MIDQHGRLVEYLRISVTDKCNLRCTYCMPLEGLPWMRRAELLTYEEIARIVRIMAGMGLTRVRLTGGEPLIRRDLPELVKLLAAVPGIEDLSLSTNAVRVTEVMIENGCPIHLFTQHNDDVNRDPSEAVGRPSGFTSGPWDGPKTSGVST